MKRLMPPLFFIGLLLGWECLSRCYEWRFVLPAPSDIFVTLFERRERFLFHSLVTLKEMAGGFCLATVGAFAFAWIMWASRSVRDLLFPLFVWIQCIPMFTLAPVMVVWLGWSYMTICVPTALMIFFPMTMTIYQGLSAVPKHLSDYFYLNEASYRQLFLRLQLPMAAPYIFAGVKISAAVAGIGAIAAEWAGARHGLGVLMLTSRRESDLATTFGALFCLTALTMTFYGLAVLCERRVAVVRYAKHVVTAFLCLFLLGGCQKEPESGRKRLLLDWYPNPNHVALFAGRELGFFDEEMGGIEFIELKDPADTLPLITTGQADFALYYPIDTIRAQKMGARIEPVAAVIGRPLGGLLFRQDEGIVTPRDLSGKVFGYSISMTKGILDFMLRHNGIRPVDEKNVSFDIVSSLGSEQIDVVYGAYWNIETEHLRSLGIDTGYFTCEELGVPSHPELVVISCGQKDEAFLRALQKSLDYARGHPEEAFALYAGANPDKSEKTLQWEKRAWQLTYPQLAWSAEIDWEEWRAFSMFLESALRISS